MRIFGKPVIACSTLLAAALLATPVGSAQAQCVTNYDGTARWGIVNTGYDKIGICGTSSSMVEVLVRVLSGSSGNPQGLYFLGVDGAATTIANITTGSPPAGTNIPLNKPAGCFINNTECLWDGTPYAFTSLGVHSTTDLLVFGLRTGGNQWLVSGNTTTGASSTLYTYGRQTDGAGNLVYATGGIFADDRTTRMPPPVMSGWVYGFDDNGRGPCDKPGFKGAANTGGCTLTGSGQLYSSLSDKDYQDLIFEIQVRDVVPEPASIALFATGLVGLAAFARRRRND